MGICTVAVLKHWAILTSDKGLKHCIEVLRSKRQISIPGPATPRGIPLSRLSRSEMPALSALTKYCHVPPLVSVIPSSSQRDDPKGGMTRQNRMLTWSIDMAHEKL